MRTLLTIITMTLLWNNLYSQLHDRIWIFGRPVADTTNATLFFGNAANPVIALPGGQPHSITTGNGSETWSVVTNPFTGDMIFYTDGKDVFDHQHNLVSAVDLGAHVSSVQPVAIAPVPRSELKSSFLKYYIFSNETGAHVSNYTTGKIIYRLYDATIQSFGQTVNLPGIYGDSTVTEGMKIIRNSHNPDVLWLVASLFPSPGMENRYVIYKIDKYTVSYHSHIDLGPQKTALSSGASPILHITTSHANLPAGITNVGFALQHSSAVFTCHFNDTTGHFIPNTLKVCNTGYTNSLPSVYNVEFSPNGQFLYYSVYRTSSNNNALFQIDLQDTVLTPVLVKSFSYPYAGGLKAGPDSLIYHIYDSGMDSHMIRLGRILQPNTKFIPGVTPVNQFYEDNFQTYNDRFGFALSEFLVLPSNSPGTGIDSHANLPATIHPIVYPNPVTGNTINIANLQEVKSIEIYDMIGNLRMTSISPTFDISTLSSGTFLIKIIDQQLRSKVCKLIIAR